MEQRPGNIPSVEPVPFDLGRKLPSQQAEFLRLCRKVQRLLSKGERVNGEIVGQLKDEHASHDGPISAEELQLAFVKCLVIDLLGQGWSLRVSGKKALLLPPAEETGSLSAMKEQIRQSHLIERDAQLRESSVAEFVTGMERRRLTSKGWHSIFSLMRDGRDLSARLRKAAETVDVEHRLAQLSRVVSPYLQFVEGDAVCEHTGPLLRDIWRYYRHTWVNVYKSLPGRSIMVLVRDAAAPNHPVMGIAALGSSVVQSAIRDEWIGWNSETFLRRLSEKPTAKMSKWILDSLEQLTRAIYTKDLRAEGICGTLDIQYPTDKVIEKLRRESQRAIEQHRLFPRAAYHKSQRTEPNGTVHWDAQAKSSLFRSKRCKTLASLLAIRHTLQEAGLISPSGKRLKAALETASVRDAIGQLVRQVKAEHVGVDMMDIIVCGAIAPYNHILGGKLVCMLLCSPEVVQFYRQKYKKQVSVIASSMKGAPVVREPRLVFLGTTSLYGVGSSQYNRVRIPAGEVGGDVSAQVEYKELGLSEGYGSFHFGSQTLDLMNVMLARSKNGRRVNSIFGEGVNPLMRKIREALELVGLPSDPILRHGNKRVVYGVSLATNFGDVLLGLADRPKYLLPQTKPAQRTALIANFWRKRWLMPRISRPEILEQISKHTLTYPIRHGARVPTLDEASQRSLAEI